MPCCCINDFSSQRIITDKRGQQGIKTGNGLGAGRFALQCIEKIDDLAEISSTSGKDPRRSSWASVSALSVSFLASRPPNSPVAFPASEIADVILEESNSTILPSRFFIVSNMLSNLHGKNYQAPQHQLGYLADISKERSKDNLMKC